MRTMMENKKPQYSFETLLQFCHVLQEPSMENWGKMFKNMFYERSDSLEMLKLAHKKRGGKIFKEILKKC